MSYIFIYKYHTLKHSLKTTITNQRKKEKKKRRVKMEDMPPGFRFYPTEEELVSFFLRNKLEGNREDLNHLMNRVIPVVDIYEFNPWDLPRT